MFQTENFACKMGHKNLTIFYPRILSIVSIDNTKFKAQSSLLYVYRYLKNKMLDFRFKFKGLT